MVVVVVVIVVVVVVVGVFVVPTFLAPQGARALRATDLVLLVPSEAAEEVQNDQEILGCTSKMKQDESNLNIPELC